MAYKNVTISIQTAELSKIRDYAKEKERTISWIFKTGALRMIKRSEKYPYQERIDHLNERYYNKPIPFSHSKQCPWCLGPPDKRFEELEDFKD